MFKSKFFWGGLLLCLVAFCGILFYRTNQQPQEPRKIFKYTPREQRTTSQISDNPSVQTNGDLNETDVASTSVDSGRVNGVGHITSTDAQLSDGGVQSDKNMPLTDETGVPSTSEPKEQRFFGLTLDEIEQQIPVLEQEIRTNLTKAVELYTELRSTDGMAAKSAEIAAWRDETWKEVKQLFYDVSRTGKIMRYTSFLKVVGEEQNPLLRGGWIFELIEPLPMRVTVGTSQ